MPLICKETEFLKLSKNISLTFGLQTIKMEIRRNQILTPETSVTYATDALKEFHPLQNP